MSLVRVKTLIRNSVCPSGLIIDAFGELRDQQEQVREDMEVRGCVSGGFNNITISLPVTQ